MAPRFYWWLLTLQQFYTGFTVVVWYCCNVGDREPLVLVSGSSNCGTHNVGFLTRLLTPVTSILIVTPSKKHSKVKYTVASARPICCGLIGRHRNVAVCHYSNAPISYVGVTLRRFTSHRPSVVVNNVGRNSGSNIGIRCSNAVNVFVRKYVGNVPSMNFSLSGRSPRTSFRPYTPCVIGVMRRILRHKLPGNAYLGIGFPTAPVCRKIGIYHVTGKR